jgi:hypothetical protein
MRRGRLDPGLGDDAPAEMTAIAGVEIPRTARAGVLARTRTSASTALIAGLAGVVVLLAVAGPFMARYGWDRDELYFLSAAHHLSLGYVDFPPLIAVAGWAVDKLAPDSLVALRSVSLAAGAGTVVLVALIARELGGGRRAQWIAAISWALTPYIFGSASIFHPTWLDALAWIALLYVAVRLLVRRLPRLWLALGVIAGVGLEAKYTIAFLILAFAAALALTEERRQLRTAWPWIGLAIALALMGPNLIWQVEHGWPSVHFFATQNAKTGSDTSRPAYIAEQLLFLGATSALAVAGVVWMWRRGLRALALVPVIVTLIFLLERGRSYYPLPADALAVAAGAIAVDGSLHSGRRLLLAGALATMQLAVILLAAPIVVPFYSTQHLVSSSVWKTGYFKDEIGWPEMTAQVERSWAALPANDRANGAILAANYGEASALESYGRGLGPILSGHLSWQYWHPRHLPQRFALTVGYPPSGLHVLCSSWRPLAHIDNRWHLDNEERGRLIAACTFKQPLGSIWTRLIATNQL